LAEIVLCSILTAYGHDQASHPMHNVDLSPEVKIADHLRPSDAEVKNAYSYASRFSTHLHDLLFN
jgi:hypothetical protein